MVQLLILHGTFSNLKPDQYLNTGGCGTKKRAESGRGSSGLYFSLVSPLSVEEAKFPMMQVFQTSVTLIAEAGIDRTVQDIGSS